ncbi:MAG: molybdenum cofactor guanylyltransferase [Nitrospinae bacterium]|nr:molybdenum cofactor guanylyltransferase [Nitrospinota bacterium]MBI3815306.1 molybdenum cofactor guanylyltransferase [Nitrospinota bacterium]
MTGVILSGGRNSRIGLKKAFLEIEGKRIIDRTVEIYKKVFDEILIITNTPEDYQYLSPKFLMGDPKLKIYTDLIPHRGSLGGIYTGLNYSKSEYAFFSACDMPFINEKVIRHIIKGARGNGQGAKDYDIIVPYFKRRLHPLHAVYSKRCLQIFKEMAEEDRLKIKDLFSRFKVKRITDIPETKLPPFFNINTIEDYKKAVSALNKSK